MRGFRLHKDTVRSRETARRSCASGEKAIWVTVSVWHGSVCSWRHDAVLHSRTAACSALDACKDGAESFYLYKYKYFSLSFTHSFLIIFYTCFCLFSPHLIFFSPVAVVSKNTTESLLACLLVGKHSLNAVEG